MIPTLKATLRASLMVQCLRLHVPNAGVLGLIPGQGTRSPMLQQRVCMSLRAHMPQLNITHAATKDPIPHAETKTLGLPKE